MKNLVSIPFKRERHSELAEGLVEVTTDIVSIPFKRERHSEPWRIHRYEGAGKKVSIPFKRERHSELFTLTLVLILVLFQFPSNGKDILNSSDFSYSVNDEVCFNSLQTGKTF